MYRTPFTVTIHLYNEIQRISYSVQLATIVSHSWMIKLGLCETINQSQFTQHYRHRPKLEKSLRDTKGVKFAGWLARLLPQVCGQKQGAVYLELKDEWLYNKLKLSDYVFRDIFSDNEAKITNTDNIGKFGCFCTHLGFSVFFFGWLFTCHIYICEWLHFMYTLMLIQNLDELYSTLS